MVAYRAVAGSVRSPTPTVALVDGLTASDLQACAARVASWRDAGLAAPLLLPIAEFRRSLDAFPFEFGAILADHVVICGPSPFEGLRVEPADLRHACERQARSHLLHLREGYMETEGRGSAIADLISGSAAALAGIVESVARLREGAARDVEAAAREIEELIGVKDGAIRRVVMLADGRSVGADEARRLFPLYLDALERLTHYIDRWRPE